MAENASKKDSGPRLLLFSLADEQYGFDLARVEEVFELGEEPSPVLGAPAWLSGLLNHHGQVVPVLDLAGLLGLKAGQPARQALLVDVAGQSLALAVDQIAGIETVTGVAAGDQGAARAWHRGRLLSLLKPEDIEKSLESSLTTMRRP